MSKQSRQKVPSTTHTLKIVLVRHGEAGGEDGPLGPPLTPLGRRQAQRVARRLSTETFAHIYISDMARAHLTAAPIVKEHPGTQQTVTKVLREIEKHMILAGATPGGRASRQETRRRRTELGSFARRLVNRHKRDDQVLVVAHGNLIRFLVPTLAGVNPKRAVFFETNNASVNEVLIQDGRFYRLHRTNDTHHLLQNQVT